MLAYYVAWHLRDVWSEFLFDEESMCEQLAARAQVLAACPSEKTKVKKRTDERFCTDAGIKYRIESFRTLLSQLATRCRNVCRIDGRLSDAEFEILTSPSELQRTLLTRVETLRSRYS